MSYNTIAIITLNGLIAGMETNSEIPVQLSELKLLKTLLEQDEKVSTAITSATEFTYGVTIQPSKMGLFPTMDSCQSVVDLAYSQLPLRSNNAIFGLLMTYHNTLLQAMEKETNYVPRK